MKTSAEWAAEARRRFSTCMTRAEMAEIIAEAVAEAVEESERLKHIVIAARDLAEAFQKKICATASLESAEHTLRNALRNFRDADST